MIDFGKTAADYARYRVAFAPRLFERLREFGVGLAGQKILDLGAGTGLLAGPLRGSECDVTCVDLSAELLVAAESRKNQIIARAEAIPFADSSFDAVTAAQCWHWFDRSHAPREMMRVLRPGGRIAVIYQTYIPLPATIAQRTEELILRHRPGWRHANSTGINGQALRDLQISGFENIESFSFDVGINFTRENWRGYIRATSAVGASMSTQDLQGFDREHDAILHAEHEPFQIPHRVFTAFARKPSVARKPDVRV